MMGVGKSYKVAVTAHAAGSRHAGLTPNRMISTLHSLTVGRACPRWIVCQGRGLIVEGLQVLHIILLIISPIFGAPRH